jgi:hypothetical protein
LVTAKDGYSVQVAGVERPDILTGDVKRISDGDLVIIGWPYQVKRLAIAAVKTSGSAPITVQPSPYGPQSPIPGSLSGASRHRASQLELTVPRPGTSPSEARATG